MKCKCFTSDWLKAVSIIVINPIKLPEPGTVTLGTATTPTPAVPGERMNEWPGHRLYILYLKCNSLFVETTLRAAGTEQQQEEGGKRAMKQN